MNLSTQLRAILLIVGVVVLITIYFIGRRKSTTQRRMQAPAIEPELHAANFDDEEDNDEPHVTYGTAASVPHYVRRSAIAGRGTSLDDESPAAVDLPPVYVESNTQQHRDAQSWSELPVHTMSEFSAADVRREPVFDSHAADEGPEVLEHQSSANAHEPSIDQTAPLRKEPVEPPPQVPTMDESMETGPHRARVHSTPIGTTAPTLSQSVAKPSASIAKQQGRRYESPISNPRTAPSAAATKPASRKIVALRLAFGAERISGERLLELLTDEDLQHGKFNIFHRMYNGAALFSVASMVEPGSFDVDAMAQQQFPGITMFALLPGPIEPVKIFDLMMECAQNFVSATGAVLQDERGVALLPQGVERMREDVLNFQHLMG